MNKKYILVDFFDTLVKRTVSHHTIKFLTMKKIGEDLNYRVDFQTLFEYRLAAEIDLQTINKKEDNEFTFYELAEKILDKIETYNEIKVNKAEFIEKFIKINNEYEMNNLCCNVKLVHKLKNLKKQGCKIFCVKPFSPVMFCIL